MLGVCAVRRRAILVAMNPSRTWAIVLGVLAVLAGLLLYPLMTRHAAATRDFNDVPPSAGYFTLRPVGSYASLPSDATAAARVHRSNWEPRQDNTPYNYTTPHLLDLRPAEQAEHSYDPRWNTYILKRITGHYVGTTDEIFQWAAAKWGIPDNLIRTIAYVESGWHESNFGDFVRDRTECLPGYRAVPCPVTFGIVGVKSTSWRGIFPWNRDSTAAAVDVLGGWLRGCYEGWVWWLRAPGNHFHGTYHAGDIWGCVGAWYSGEWYDGSPHDEQSGEGYIYQVKYWEKVQPWLRGGFGF